MNYKIVIIVIGVCFGTVAGLDSKASRKQDTYLEYFRPDELQLRPYYRTPSSSSTKYHNYNELVSTAQGIDPNTPFQLASNAVRAEQATLEGKRALLENMKHQVYDAQQTLIDEMQQLRMTRQSTISAIKSVQQFEDHLTALQQVLKSAEISLDCAKQTVIDANTDLVSQANMVRRARVRLDELQEKLHQIRLQYGAIKQAAQDAAEAQNTARYATPQMESSNVQIQNGAEPNDAYLIDESTFKQFRPQPLKYFSDFN